MAEDVLTPEARGFVERLHDEFEQRRRELLARRVDRQAELDAGASLHFAAGTKDLRDTAWTVAPVPEALQRRGVEITGPATPEKMVRGALKSGADGFMADFEDALSPTWGNVIQGQRNLKAAVADGLQANLIVRPRGWHLTERHVTAGDDDAAVAGAFVDAGLFCFHNAKLLADRGEGPFLYLPKLENHREARLWNDVLNFISDDVGIPRGTIKVTVLIETVPAAFEMDEILFELRDHAAGLNAGRWDYLFSMIKCHRTRPEFVLPDRNAVTMTAPFMRAYTELLVKTCHRRGAHAMGGMAAFLPSKDDPAADERAMAKVREDKAREAGDGFDGTWVAHPKFVAPAQEELDRVLDGRPNQTDQPDDASGRPSASPDGERAASLAREEMMVTAADLLDVASTPGEPTAAGLRSDVDVGIAYLDAWLHGNGAVGINGLMEDAATAEIARGQAWQWRRHEVRLDDGSTVTTDRIRDEIAAEPRPPAARALFERLALADDFPPFLTGPAYDRLDE